MTTAPADAPLVIIVDDDPAVRAALAVNAELDGYRVATYGSAEDLLSLTLPEARTCLVIDERLPGLSGLGALAHLRGHGCRLPVVLVTSHPSRRLLALAAQARVEVLEKPLLGDGLITWIRAAAPK